MKRVEYEDAVLIGQQQVRSYLGRSRRPLGFFLLQLGAQHRRGTSRTFLRRRMVRLPLFRRNQIYERQRNLFYFAGSLGAAVPHDAAIDFVTEHNLKTAVLEDEVR